MPQRSRLWSTAFTPIAAAWAFVAGMLLVLIALRLVDRGLAFGRWLATLAS